MTPHGPQVPTRDVSEADDVRVQALERWLREHQDSFTRTVLEQSASRAGYSSAEFESAWQRTASNVPWRTGRRRLTIQATLITITAYIAVWAVFAMDFLGPTLGLVSGTGLLQILTITLLGALAMSLAWTTNTRPDPERAMRSMAVLLSVPLALLVAVAGSCLPFAGMN